MKKSGLIERQLAHARYRAAVHIFSAGMFKAL